MFRTFEILILLAGLAQLAIACTSVLIPRLLGWREETARLRPLTRQVFWTYATYILAINAAFGALSLLMPRALIDGSSLARAVQRLTGAVLVRAPGAAIHRLRSRGGRSASHVPRGGGDVRQRVCVSRMRLRGGGGVVMTPAMQMGRWSPRSWS